jgi:hypothetical protein
MKTVGKKPKSLGHCALHTESMGGRSEPISLDQVGWEARKTPAAAEVFFLDFPLYRTYQDLATKSPADNLC